MLPAAVTDILQQELGKTVRHAVSLAGGCIAHAIRVETSEEAYFLKWSDGPAGDTFQAEASGLRLLRRAPHPLYVPDVVLVRPRESDLPGLLLLEWIDEGALKPAFWQRFGSGLAEMHRHAAERFGLDDDNFIGRLPQQNGWHAEWPAFFLQRRLEPQAERLRGQGTWDQRWSAGYENLEARLEDILPSAPEASLVHGDLWSGNYMVHVAGEPVLVDPAAHFAHREVDLAMSELFGGFDRSFYHAYREAWPMAPGYEERREVYNLYHLLNHVNHFGAAYAGGVTKILRRYE